MSDRLLDKYVGRVPPSDDRRQEEQGEQAEDFGSFGWLRGIRDRAIMLELRKKDGHIRAFGYAWIESVEFEPEEGITLHLPGGRISIKGTALSKEMRPAIRLVDGLIRQKVPWVREADRSSAIGACDDGVVVEHIAWDLDA